MSGNLTYTLVPVVVGALGGWSLGLGRTRLKPSAYRTQLSIAAVVILVKGFLFPDATTTHPLVDGAMMLLGFLIATRFRLDRLARQAQLLLGVLQERHRTGIIWAGIAAGLLCNVAWLLVDKP